MNYDVRYLSAEEFLNGDVNYMSLIVQKFGGTSVANAKLIFNVANIITRAYQEGNDVVVVVSAQGDMTDELIEKANEINTNASKREMDVLMASGEQISVALLAMAIEKLGFPVTSLLGWQAGVMTSSTYGSAMITRIDPGRIKKELDKKNIVIVAGFQGLSQYYDVTTLGRAINKDVAGWITIDDTHIDYPVVQGKDDMEYINKDVYGEFSLSGSIFLSCMNKKDFSDNYNLVYGHHMANGGMFGDVVSFTEKSCFDKHKTGELYLPDKTMHIDLFACMKTLASDSKVYNPQNISKTSESFKSFLDYVREAAICYRDSGRQDTGQIIGLSTCSEAVTNGRVILFGRLSEITKSNQKQKKAE